MSGVRVHYLATPLRYRWMGITPSLPVWLARRPRPDVVHVFGFRDVVTTVVAAWCRLRRVPYVFEALGMYEPRVRKIRVKRLFDATVARHVRHGAAAVAAVSERERRLLLEAGFPPDAVHVRGNPFPPPAPMPPRGVLRRRIGLGREPLVLYVGRIASGKGIGLLLEALREIPGTHVALVGPDDRHDAIELVEAAEGDPALAGRVHRLGPVERPLELYGDADVVVLPSEGDSFGMSAAEAAACGTPVVVTDRCGVAEFLDGAALVVSYELSALRDALQRVLSDRSLAARLGEAGRAAAARFSVDEMVERQEHIYERVLGRD